APCWLRWLVPHPWRVVARRFVGIDRRWQDGPRGADRWIEIDCGTGGNAGHRKQIEFVQVQEAGYVSVLWTGHDGSGVLVSNLDMEFAVHYQGVGTRCGPASG